MRIISKISVHSIHIFARNSEIPTPLVMISQEQQQLDPQSQKLEMYFAKLNFSKNTKETLISAVQCSFTD